MNLRRVFKRTRPAKKLEDKVSLFCVDGNAKSSTDSRKFQFRLLASILPPPHLRASFGPSFLPNVSHLVHSFVAGA